MDELANIPFPVLALFGLIILVAVLFGIFTIFKRIRDKGKVKRLLAEHAEVLEEDNQVSDGYVVGKTPQEIYDHGYNDGYAKGYSQGYSEGFSSRNASISGK